MGALPHGMFLAAGVAGRAWSEVAPPAIGHCLALTSSVPNSSPPPSSQDHVRSLAALTANVKRHGAPFRHMLFYGERRHAVCWVWLLLLVGWVPGSIVELPSASCSSAVRTLICQCCELKLRGSCMLCVHASHVPIAACLLPAAHCHVHASCKACA